MDRLEVTRLPGSDALPPAHVTPAQAGPAPVSNTLDSGFYENHGLCAQDLCSEFPTQAIGFYGQIIQIRRAK
jgi:hypothetical protein